MLSLFCLVSVIGGKNVYLRLSVSEECDNEDSIWKILQKEVLYSVVLRGFNLGKKLREEKLRLPERKCGTATHGEGAEGRFLLLHGWSGEPPSGKF